MSVRGTSGPPWHGWPLHAAAELYGRGPTHAKTYLCDEYVFCVMSGGQTAPRSLGHPPRIGATGVQAGVTGCAGSSAVNTSAAAMWS